MKSKWDVELALSEKEAIPADDVPGTRIAKEARRMKTVKTTPFLERMRQTLELNESATAAEIKVAMNRVFDAESGTDGEDEDPRVELRELATKRANEKGIDFIAALKQVQAENRQLAEAVANWYRTA